MKRNLSLITSCIGPVAILDHLHPVANKFPQQTNTAIDRYKTFLLYLGTPNVGDTTLFKPNLSPLPYIEQQSNSKEQLDLSSNNIVFLFRWTPS